MRRSLLIACFLISACSSPEHITTKTETLPFPCPTTAQNEALKVSAVERPILKPWYIRFVTAWSLSKETCTN